MCAACGLRRGDESSGATEASQLRGTAFITEGTAKCIRKVLKAASKPILLISDARRPGDVAFFKDNVPKVVTVRVEASQDTRRARGWAFASGVDDAESECGLDAYEPWDIIINNDDGADLHEHLAVLTKKAADALATRADSRREKMNKPT